MGDSNSKLPKTELIPVYDPNILDQKVSNKESFVVFVKFAANVTSHEQEDDFSKIRETNKPIYMISNENALKGGFLQKLVNRVFDETKFKKGPILVRVENGNVADIVNHSIPGGALLEFVNGKGTLTTRQKLNDNVPYYDVRTKPFGNNYVIRDEVKKSVGGGNGKDKSMFEWQLKPGGGIGMGVRGTGIGIFGGSDDDDDDDDD